MAKPGVVSIYGYRWYDPLTGRWPSRDTMDEYFNQHGIVDGGMAAGLYRFVNNTAIHAVDPYGLEEFPDDLDSLGISIPDLKRRLPGVPCKTPRSEGECCAKARLYHFRSHSYGATVCCDGRAVACNWYWTENAERTLKVGRYVGYTSALASYIQKMVGECILEHELSHLRAHKSLGEWLPSYACPCDCGIVVTHAQSEGASDGQECDAHGLSAKCLRKTVKKCDELRDPRDVLICREVMTEEARMSEAAMKRYCSLYWDTQFIVGP